MRCLGNSAGVLPSNQALESSNRKFKEGGVGKQRQNFRWLINYGLSLGVQYLSEDSATRPITREGRVDVSEFMQAATEIIAACETDTDHKQL